MSSPACGVPVPADMGHFLVEKKWDQVKWGLPRILNQLDIPGNPLENDFWEQILACYAFFGLISEIFEAREVMDERSFARLMEEIPVAVAHLSGYWDALVTWTGAIDSVVTSERRYRVIAVAARIAAKEGQSPHVFQAVELSDRADFQVDILESVWIASTQIARFIAQAFVYRGQWQPRVRLLEHCKTAEGPLDNGCIAFDRNQRRDAFGHSLQLEVTGVKIAKDAWVTRPSRFARWTNLSTTPPTAEFTCYIADSALRRECRKRFIAARRSARLLRMYFKALDRGNLELFVRPNPFPPTAEKVESHKFWEGWQRIVAEASLGDDLFSRYTGDLVSSVIASIDRGSWSHVAVCMGDGMIMESEPGGGGLSPIEKYADPRFRLALMRSDYDRSLARSRALNRLRREPKRYSYLGAFGVGVWSLFDNAPRYPTPNGLIYRGDVFPIVVL